MFLKGSFTLPLQRPCGYHWTWTNSHISAFSGITEPLGRYEFRPNTLFTGNMALESALSWVNVFPQIVLSSYPALLTLPEAGGRNFCSPHFTNSIGLCDLDLGAQSPATWVLQTVLHNTYWHWNTSSHTVRPILGSNIPAAICFLISFIILIFGPFSISRTCRYLLLSLSSVMSLRKKKTVYCILISISMCLGIGFF